MNMSPAICIIETRTPAKKMPVKENEMPEWSKKCKSGKVSREKKRTKKHVYHLNGANRG